MQETTGGKGGTGEKGKQGNGGKEGQEEQRKREKQMGQTLNGNVDTSATNGFTPGSCDQTGPGWPANMVGAWATQRAEWIAANGQTGISRC